MIIPPAVLSLTIAGKGRRKRHIWVPLFLLWLLLLPFAVLLIPLLFVVSCVVAVRKGRGRYLMMAPRFYCLVCSLRGLNVDVGDREDRFRISIG